MDPDDDSHLGVELTKFHQRPLFGEDVTSWCLSLSFFISTRVVMGVVSCRVSGPLPYCLSVFLNRPDVSSVVYDEVSLT